MFPLQIGDASFIIPAALVLGVIVLIAILALQKRASTMSDDLSKQSRAKFEALVPDLASQTKPIEETKKKSSDETVKTPTLTPAPRVEQTNYSSLSLNLQDLRSRLNDLILENRKRLGEFQETQTNFEKVKLEINGLGNRITDAEKTVAEVRSLKESMSSTNEEFQKLRICLDEQNLKLDQMKLSNDELRPRLEARLDSLLSDTNKQFEKIRETQANFEKTMSELNGSFSRLSQVERSTAEITSLKEGLLANQEELRKLRASFDEQGLKLDQISLSSSQAYTRLDSATSSLGTQPITGTGSTGPMSATASTPSLRRCIYCGSVLESRDRFCNRCGQPVT